MATVTWNMRGVLEDSFLLEFLMILASNVAQALLFSLSFCFLFGVQAAMPGFISKKLCPNLVIVPSNHEKYATMS